MIDYKKEFELLWQECVIGLAEVSTDNKFIRANPAFVNLVGYSESELQQKTWMSITHPDDVLGDKAETENLKLGKKTKYTMAKRYITKQSSVIWISLHVVAYEEDGQLKMFLVQAKPAAILHNPKTTGDREIIAALWKQNFKWAIGAFIGATLTIFGAFAASNTLIITGTTLLHGTLGAYFLIKGK